jgi:hypothetical protein
MRKIVKIPFGSHLYGTSTLQSDIDLKVIYLPELSDMVLGKKAEIYKDRPVKENECMSAGETETEFVPIHRLAYDFFSGQSWAIECTFAMLDPITNNVEFFEDRQQQMSLFARELVQRFLTKELNAMVSYAIKQSQLYGIKAERLNALERLIGFLQTIENPTVVRLADIKNALNTLLSDEIMFTIIKGTNPAHTNQPALKVNNNEYPLTSSVQYLLIELNKVRERYGERVKKAQSSEIDWKALSHAVRVVSQAVDLLKTHELKFPLANKQLLLDIKQEKIPFDDSIAIFTQLNTELEELIKTTTLQPRTEELKKRFEKWLSNWLIFNFYN